MINKKGELRKWNPTKENLYSFWKVPAFLNLVILQQKAVEKSLISSTQVILKQANRFANWANFTQKHILKKVGNKKTVLYGPAYKGIPIAVSVAVALAKNGLDVPFFFNRKEEKDHGEGGVFVGYKPQAGEEIVIVEDVITAGTAIRESMSILSGLEGTKVAATFVMVDRKEKGKTDKSAMAEVGEEYGFPVYSVVDVYDIIEYLEEDEKNRENVERIKNYLAINGAKE